MSTELNASKVIAAIAGMVIVAAIAVGLEGVEFPVFPGTEVMIDSYPGWELGHIVVFTGGSYMPAVYYASESDSRPHELDAAAFHFAGIHHWHVWTNTGAYESWWSFAISFWYLIVPAAIVLILAMRQCIRKKERSIQCESLVRNDTVSTTSDKEEAAP